MSSPTFVFSAKGDNTRIRIVFASHAITANGHSLAQLLLAFAAQRVVRLVQPSENEAKFGVRDANVSASVPRITNITIEELSKEPNGMDCLTEKGRFRSTANGRFTIGAQTVDEWCTPGEQNGLVYALVRA